MGVDFLRLRWGENGGGLSKYWERKSVITTPRATPKIVVTHLGTSENKLNSMKSLIAMPNARRIPSPEVPEAFVV